MNETNYGTGEWMWVKTSYGRVTYRSENRYATREEAEKGAAFVRQIGGGSVKVVKVTTGGVR